MNTRTGPNRKRTNTTGTVNVIPGPVESVHAVGFRNASGGDVYLMIFDSAAAPDAGATPDLPVEKVPTDMTAWVDFGAGGCPMTNIVAVLSSTDATYTAIVANVRLTVTYR